MPPTYSLIVVRRLGLLASLHSLIGLGCSSSPYAVESPEYNPQDYAESLLLRCDTNQDGSLTKDEGAKAPGLVGAWARYDSDNDGIISRGELEARAQKWRDRGDGLSSINCTVEVAGKQTSAVTVKLTPDESLTNVIHPAETTTREGRPSPFSVPPELKAPAHKNLSGMQYGLFNVSVEHPQLTLTVDPAIAQIDIGPEDQAKPVLIKVNKR